MPLPPNLKSILFALTALTALGAAEAINLRAGRAGMFQSFGKGGVDWPPWLENEKERGRGQQKKRNGIRRREEGWQRQSICCLLGEETDGQDGQVDC